MHSNFHETNLLHLLVILFAVINVLKISCDDDQQYLDCQNNFECGAVDVGYPFWGLNRPEHCGQPDYELRCENNVPKIEIGTITFRILGINPEERNLTVARDDLWSNTCPTNLVDTIIDFNLFTYAPLIRNISLFYNCTSSTGFPGLISLPNCTINGSSVNAFYWTAVIQLDASAAVCNDTVIVPLSQSSALDLDLRRIEISDALHTGFSLLWNVDSEQCNTCLGSGGSCGYETSTFTCFCHDGPNATSCSSRPDQSRWKRKLGIGLGATFGSIAAIICTMILIWIIVFYIKRKILSNKDDQELEAIINDCGPLPLKRYSFSDIKKITCSLKDKLGQGGYGSVYKGKLPNGCLVAVKVLNTTKGDGQDFMNEVLSIGRTSHVNIVTLLGFCLEGSNRALVYEFLPNGSLEKFIYQKGSTNTNHHFLGWENMFRIAIEIAQGLEYLHRGCKTRILHFDIKPHNILLDEDFCPKISDFGLAKLCIKKESFVSILEARGTIGYIAAELFSRNFGGVSHKSDVYSYGMMILEMVGARNNTNIKGGNSSDTYFPHWIYKRLEEENDFRLNGSVMTELENEVARKMVLVGLWCIQTDLSHRPNISEVLDMLKGNIDKLQIAPRPFMTSPTRSFLLESFNSSGS